MNSSLTLLLLLSLIGSLYADGRKPVPLGQSIEEVSATFLSARFATDALGEGKGQYDSDPRFRVDAFDCTTFIETVWAIHSSKAEQDWTQILQDIRYRDSRQTFVDRLHFISRDWLRHHQHRGKIKDVTAALGLPLLESRTLIDRRAWYQKKHPQLLKQFDARYPQESADWVTFQFVTFAEVLARPEAIGKLRAELGKGALLANFVRPNFDLVTTIGTSIDITHQGFLLIKDGNITLRHASLSLLQVGDEDFIDYMRFYRNHASLKGMQLVRLL